MIETINPGDAVQDTATMRTGVVCAVISNMGIRVFYDDGQEPQFVDYPWVGPGQVDGITKA